MERYYIAIDLKSFYASVECVERKLDPMTTNLVVADESRTEKTICLAVSPSLKAYGIPGRARLFEVVQRVGEVNALRRSRAPGRELVGSAWDSEELLRHPEKKLDYIVAKPRMRYYMDYSARIYKIYLKYVAPEDIHVYSIDEVFIDATAYLKLYKLDARSFAKKLVLEVLAHTGITATAGVGTNLYLCKIAMDMMAKRVSADKDGVRIACLDEGSYREKLWDHRPLTDFWRVGPGIARKLERRGIYTMGDIALQSLLPGPFGEQSLYDLFGVNAEYLIDHAWGYEPTEISDIKSYRPENSSLSSGQVLQEPYDFSKARLVLKEMADLLSLDLVEKGLCTDQIVLTVGYDIKSCTDAYKGETEIDRYGRKIPKTAHGSQNIGRFTCSTKLITSAAMTLFDKIVSKNLLVRRMYIVANHIVSEKKAKKEKDYVQLDLFSDPQAEIDIENAVEKEKDMQKAIVNIKKKFGKNAIIKGMNLKEGATALERNKQIGGHKA